MAKNARKKSNFLPIENMLASYKGVRINEAVERETII